MRHSEGAVISVGLKLDTEGETEYIRHTWTVFENGSGPIDGSCGSPILDQQGLVIGLFRFKIRGDEGCLAVSATELVRDMPWRTTVLTIMYYDVHNCRLCSSKQLCLRSSSGIGGSEPMTAKRRRFETNSFIFVN